MCHAWVLWEAAGLIAEAGQDRRGEGTEVAISLNAPSFRSNHANPGKLTEVQVGTISLSLHSLTGLEKTSGKAKIQITQRAKQWRWPFQGQSDHMELCKGEGLVLWRSATLLAGAALQESASSVKAPESVGTDEPGGCPTLTLHCSHRWVSENTDLPSLRKLRNFSQLNTVAFKTVNTNVLCVVLYTPWKIQLFQHIAQHRFS